MTVKDRIDLARQKEFVTVEEAALLVGVSERTIWRRLPQLDRTIRNGKVVRIHRQTLVRYFLNWPIPKPPTTIQIPG